MYFAPIPFRLATTRPPHLTGLFGRETLHRGPVFALRGATSLRAGRRSASHSETLRPFSVARIPGHGATSPGSVADDVLHGANVVEHSIRVNRRRRSLGRGRFPPLTAALSLSAPAPPAPPPPRAGRSTGRRRPPAWRSPGA